MLRNITWVIKENESTSYLSFQLTDDSISEQDLIDEVVKAINMLKTKIFFLNGHDLVKVSEINRKLTKNELSKICISTKAISDVVHTNHPEWFHVNSKSKRENAPDDIYDAIMLNKQSL